MRLTGRDVLEATGGRWTARTAPEGVAFDGVAFDSRVLVPGQVFVALHGERDGHDFVTDAFLRGAVAAIVSDDRGGPDPRVVVADTQVALHDLARAARVRLHDAMVVGITGSVGKTSTKDLAAGAIGAARRVHASPASFNNEVGVPATLLGAPGDVEVVVTEMGARAPGDIATLCRLARPRVGVVTNIGMAHAERLGGPIGIARVKAEMFDDLPSGGVAIMPADGPGRAELRSRVPGEVGTLTVGPTSTADVCFEGVRVDGDLRVHFALATPWGSTAVDLRMRGAHQAANAAFAAAAALVLDVPLDAVVAGLSDVSGSYWRMEVTRGRDGIVLVNDAYNSNPESARAALDALALLDVPGRRIAVLGEMRELGATSAAEHRRLGEHAAALGLDLIVTVGAAVGTTAEAALARGVPVLRAPDAAAAADVVSATATAGDAVLVKASRAVGLEVVAEALGVSPVLGVLTPDAVVAEAGPGGLR